MNIHKFDPFSMLPLRLAVGTIFFAHGSQKLFGWFGGLGWSATIQTFREGLGIPAVLAAISIFTEFFGGIFVALGLFTRTSALLLAMVMAVAIVKVHWPHGFFLNWFSLPTHGHGIEYSLALLGACLTLAATGAKRPSLDQLFFHHRDD